jgi:pre-mRNA-splicing factor CWC26
MPSPEHEGNSLQYGGDDTDLSPPCQRQRQYHIPSPAPDTNLNSDLSSPHKRRYRNDTPSPEPPMKPSGEVSDL